MTSTITSAVIKRIVKRLILPGQDYRQEIINILDAEFLDFVMSFFKKVALAKIDNKKIDFDWYKSHFVDENLPKKEIALNSGLNLKTINNMYSSTRKEVVIDAASQHYENLKNTIETLTAADSDMNFTLTIKIGKVSVDLNINESLIVINGISVHRAAMRGGLWSTAGKRSEKILMITLCKMYSVDERYWDVKQKKEDGYSTFDREIDFFLIKDEMRYKCEVKLIGKGNPESADAVVARGSHVFIADTLSNTNIHQLNSLNVHWVALSQPSGYKRFKQVLNQLNIPHREFDGDLETRVEQILSEIDSRPPQR